jgi:non-specific serine/threonine protein kinase
MHPSSPQSPSSQSLRFGRVELQPQERRLRVDGQVVALGARAFDMLVLLAQRPGQLVTKAELLERVWPGLVVEENNIAAQVVALRKVLGGALISTVPGHGYRFEAQPDAAPAEAPAAASPSPAAAAPPSPGPRLVGRGDDLDLLEAALQAPGALTLVGPAGVGKTSLAQLLAARWHGRSVWVDLAAVSEAGQVVPALARALGQSWPAGGEAAALLPHLAGVTLVVLDNAEHLIDAVAGLVRVLAPAAPATRLLVTSQMAIGLADERVLRIGPLPVPPPEMPCSAALQHGAVGLLVARVAALDGRVVLGEAQLPLLRGIAQQLDGLPLALEMAAARVPLLGLQAVFDGLGERFDMLRRGHRGAAGRHQSLKAALDWSHALLAPAEQTLFRTLGVFSGGFTLELMLAVAGGDAATRWDLVDTLGTLVDRSLVVTDPGDPPRYRLLDTPRSYALDQLAAAGDDGAVRQRHAHALHERLAAIKLQHQHQMDRGLATAPVLAACVAELPNVRDALAWLQSRDPTRAATMALQASTMLTFTEWRNDTFRWLLACEPQVGQLPPALQALWWRELGRHRLFNGLPGAVDAAQRARHLYLALGDDDGLFWAAVCTARACDTVCDELRSSLQDMSDTLDRHPEWPARQRLLAAGTRASALHLQGDYAGFLQQLEAERVLALEMGDVERAAAAQCNAIDALRLLGRFDEAVQRSRAALSQPDGAVDSNAAYLRVTLLASLLGAGRPDEALAEVRTTLQVCRRFGLLTIGAWLALLAAHQSRPRAAAQLVGHTVAAYQQRGAAPYADILVVLQQVRDITARALGEAAARRHEQRGALLGPAEADALLYTAADAA